MPILKTMSYIMFTMALGLTILVVAANANQADCIPVDMAIEKLTKEYDEIPIATMKDQQGVPMGLWANLQTGSWSLVFLRGDESRTEMCMLDSGHNFRVGR